MIPVEQEQHNLLPSEGPFRQQDPSSNLYPLERVPGVMVRATAMIPSPEVVQ